MKIIDNTDELLCKDSFPIERVRVDRDNQISHEAFNDAVIIEHHMAVFINGQLAFKLVCTPQKLDALVLGFLFSEGYVKSIDDIEYIYICKSGEQAKVQLNKILQLSKIEHDTASASISCGNNKMIRKAAFTSSLSMLPSHKWSHETIFELADVCNRDAELFSETGGTHSCALSIKGKLAFTCEDIGRHNAVDKIIGLALAAKKDLNEAIIFTSGRTPSDLVIKAIRSGIPVIASHSAPTNEAIELALAFNLTLIGFVRGRRMNIYTGSR